MHKIQHNAINILTHNSVNFESKDFQQILTCFKKNKISLVELANDRNGQLFECFFESTEFKQAYLDELNRKTQWENDFLLIKKEWDKYEIEYLFHKSTGLFPSMSDNLDVLVQTKHFKKAGEVLIQMGYVNLRNIQEAHKEFYRKFRGDKIIVPIHLHERVCWVVPFDNNEHIWDYYQTDFSKPTINYPGFEDCILTNTAHCFLEDHIIKIFDLLAIKKSIECKSIDWEYIIQTASECFWEKSLFSAFIIFNFLYHDLFGTELIPSDILDRAKQSIEKDKWISKKINDDILKRPVKMPFRIPHFWIRRHTIIRELRDPAFGNKLGRYYQVLGGLIDRFIHLKLSIKNHPNCLIAFSGLDGSGKSQHIRLLQKAFSTCDIQTSIVWSRPGSMLLTSLILKFLHLLVKTQKSRSTFISSTKKQSPIYSFWRLLNVIDLILYYFFKIRLRLLTGKVVIADRYIHDAIVDMESTSRSNTTIRFVYRFLQTLSPKPDVTFFLDVPVDTIITRGTDEKKLDLDIKLSLYEQCITENKKLMIIDNIGDIQEVNSKVSTFALSKFFGKYPEKFSGYKIVSFCYK
ncbi:MAG: nucleotidyltransferase family protein [Bacteroidales bacterium]|jgi:thymidylate kinase|nr:nucleotidyltransferase family protein [Bacteroidales bacterium]